MTEPVYGAVLPGGGAFGAFQARCLYQVAMNGHPGYHVAAGVSVGNLAAAYIQQFTDFKFGAGLYWELWDKLARKQVWRHHFPFGPIHGFWTPNVLNSSPLTKLITENLDRQKILDTGKTFYGATYDLQADQLRWFDEGEPDLAKWIEASASFPGAFKPPVIDGRQHTDGGVNTVTPLAKVIAAGCTHVDVFLTGQAPTDEPKELGPVSNVLEMFARTLQILIDNVQRKDLKVAWLYNRLVQAGAAGEKREVQIRVFEPDVALPGGPLDFDPQHTHDMAHIADRVAPRVING